uniref:Secreted protein n=1 Tax=Trichogramma kaykai TaxID=54128 RepID=A0ABD2VXN3_9HYME
MLALFFSFTPLPFYSRASFAVFLFGKRASENERAKKNPYGASQCSSKRRRLDLVTYVTAYRARVCAYCLSRDPLSCLSRAARRATYLDVLARHLRRLDDKILAYVTRHRGKYYMFCKIPRLLPLLLPPLYSAGFHFAIKCRY